MVEAHGSGTLLGDAVELEALVASFRSHTERKGFCALGSVKSNIGHANSAAGIASLIKVILSLKHRAVPASLNFRGNPALGLDQSPLFHQHPAARAKPRRPRPWPRLTALAPPAPRFTWRWRHGTRNPLTWPAHGFRGGRLTWKALIPRRDAPAFRLFPLTIRGAGWTRPRLKESPLGPGRIQVDRKIRGQADGRQTLMLKPA